mmetsp:Transcript_11493/g.70665  ORF Transcript_11493/g.70665 Transcript_11493/m.70665 type:complete len:296 (-) Transcript_11493:2790-3677(-)
MWHAVQGDVERIGRWKEANEEEAVVLERAEGTNRGCHVQVRCPEVGQPWDLACVETDAKTCEVHVRGRGEVEFSYAETLTNGETDEVGKGRMIARPRPGHPWEELLLILRPNKTKPNTITLHKVQFMTDDTDTQDEDEGAEIDKEKARKLVDSQMGDVRTFLQEKKRQAEEEQAKGMNAGLVSGNPLALMLSAMSRMNPNDRKAESTSSSARKLVEESIPQGNERRGTEPATQHNLHEYPKRKTERAPLGQAEEEKGTIQLLERRIVSLEKVVYAALEGFNARICHLEEKLERVT